MKNPFFSVVVSIYNSEKYVVEMIDSVKSQTLQQWELILVDDGSTDRSGVLCDEQAMRDERIKVIHNKNQGGLVARYNGVKQCKGEYIIVIDSDDRMVHDCLEKVKQAILISKADMVIWGFRTFGSEAREVKFPLQPNKLYTQKEIMYTSLMYSIHSLWTRAIRTNIMKKSCTCNLGNLSVNTDYAMLIPILCNIHNAYVLNDILYEYRIYKDSISHSLAVNKIIDTDTVSEYAIREINRYEMYDENVEKAIYVSYLKMIWGRIFSMLLYGMINSNQCRMIHSLPVYKKSVKYEKRNFFRRRDLILMKLFRKSIYIPFQVLYFARLCKNSNRKRFR